jgi:hypothetical protein
MVKFDLEDLLQTVHAIMTTGNALNVKIAAIDAEKTAKGQTLATALKPIAAYYLQSWSDKILTTSPAIFYGVEDVQTADGGGATSKVFKIFVEVVLVDSGQTNDVFKRIARYSRALEETFLEAIVGIGFNAVPGSRVKIDTVRPVSFKLELDSDEEIKVGGISLTIAIY